MPTSRSPRKTAAPRPRKVPDATAAAPSSKPATPKKPVRSAKAAAGAEVPAATAAAPAHASDAPVTAGKPPKEPRSAKRAKPVRDSFTMPEADFALIGSLKARALAQGRVTKKSELLRAGLQALAALDAQALLAALERLEPVKIGRPGKGR